MALIHFSNDVGFGIPKNAVIRLPMTSYIFVNKLKRSMYQASIWLQADRKTMNLPEPEDWGSRRPKGIPWILTGAHSWMS